MQGGSKNVNLALSLVGYPAEVEAAMKNIFGGTLVCNDMDTAQKVSCVGRGSVRLSFLSSLSCD